MSNSKIKQPDLDAEVPFDSLKDVDWREQQDLLLQSCSILSNLPKKHLPYTFKRVIRMEPTNELLAFDEPNCLNFLAQAEGEADGKTISIALHIGILKVGGESHFEHFLRCHDVVAESARASGGNKYTLSLIIHTGFPEGLDYICNDCVITRYGWCIVEGTRKAYVGEEIVKGFPNVPFIFMNVKQFVKLYQAKSPQLNELAEPFQQFLLMLGDFESFYLEYFTGQSFRTDQDLIPLALHFRERYLKHCQSNQSEELDPRTKRIFSEPEGQAILELLSKEKKAGKLPPAFVELYSLTCSRKSG